MDFLYQVRRKHRYSIYKLMFGFCFFIIYSVVLFLLADKILFVILFAILMWGQWTIKRTIGIDSDRIEAFCVQKLSELPENGVLCCLFLIILGTCWLISYAYKNRTNGNQSEITQNKIVNSNNLNNYGTKIPQPQ